MTHTASLVQTPSGATRVASLALVAALCATSSPNARPQNEQAPNGVDALTVEASCSLIEPGTWVARFSWPSSLLQAPGALEITAFYGGFEAGRFDTITRLKSGQSSFSWSGGNPGAEYLWRIRSGTGPRQRVSEAARYRVPVCPVDYVDPQIDEPAAKPVD